jgi:phosphatidylglycerol:prolipoprotein diacylglycerol transferase
MFPHLFTIPAFDLIGRHFGPISVPSYGLILFLAFLAGLWIVAREARRAGLDSTLMTDLAIYALIGGLIGAKLLLVFVDRRAYIYAPRELLSVFFSGGVFYGGLIGGIVAAIYYIRKHKIPFWPALDVLAPGVIIGQAVGRFACLAAGCCYGRPTTVPWAIIYRNVAAFNAVGTPLDTPVHPSPIYESMASVGILLLLLWIAGRKRFHGQVTVSYVVLYSATRFILEYFRGDLVRGFVFGGVLSTSQFISLLLLVAALAATPYLMKKNRIEAPAT